MSAPIEQRIYWHITDDVPTAARAYLCMQGYGWPVLRATRVGKCWLTTIDLGAAVEGEPERLCALLDADPRVDSYAGGA